jgi:hypothetical protein
MTEENEIVEEHLSEIQEQETPRKEQKEPVSNSQEKNWDAVREVLRLQKQRIEELEARSSLEQQVKPEEQDEFDKLDPDDYMTVGKAKELAKRLANKEASHTAKQVINEYIQQQKVVKDEEKMRSKYEDFDYVIEHFAIPMIKNDPALAHKIQNSKNPAQAAYKLGKISDEYEESTMNQQPSARAEKILKNSSRPVSGNAVGSTLKSQAGDFSKMSKEDIWAMSQKYARGA